MRVYVIPMLLMSLLAMCADGEAFLNDVQTAAKPWTDREVNNDPSVFRFAIVTDNAGGPRWGIFGEAMDKINLMQPEFVMSIGDYIEGYEESREGLQAQWKRFMGDIDKLEMPFFFVPGNHDNGRALWSDIYNERFGVPYYSFLYKDVLFLCLCTNDGPEHNTGVSDAQVDYVRRTLEKHDDVRWTLVFQHKPLWNEDGQENWEKIEAMLKERNCTVFAGHTHNYLYQEEDGISFITLATTGGGTALRGVAYGEFDQIAWVTMLDEGPRIANILLDGIRPKELRTADLVEKLDLFRRGNAVVATPILTQGETFSEGVSTLKISNPADQPLRVSVLMEMEPGIVVTPGSISAVIPPRGEHALELHVRAESPVPLPAVQPVVLHWRADYDSLENSPGTTLEGLTRVMTDGPFTVPAADAAITVDGDLAEWDELPFVVNQPAEIYTNPAAWKGVTDSAFRFGVRRDDEFVYVAVRVIDDEPCFEGWKYWEDFAMIALDARKAPSDDIENAVFTVITGPEVTPEQAAEYEIGESPAQAQRASRQTADGFTAEVALPLAYVSERQGGDWDHLRLNVSVSDFDKHDSRDGVTILHWRPDWTGRGGYPEAGTFVKGS